MANTRLKVSTQALLDKVLSLNESEQTEYDAAVKAYDREYAAWKKAAYKAVAAVKSVDGLSVTSQMQYGDGGERQRITSASVPVPPQPQKPVRAGNHEKIIRLLQATTQSEITISTNDDLYRYL